MADLRVIDGGKGTERSARQIQEDNFDTAVRLYVEVIRQTLRLLAGSKNVVDAGHAIVHFFDFISDNQVLYMLAMERGAFNAHNELWERLGLDGDDLQLLSVVQSSLKVYAESLAEDGYSKARFSKRTDDLRLRIENFAEDYGRQRK